MDLYPRSAKLKIYDTTIRNNSAPSVLVEFEDRSDTFNKGCAIILQDLLFDGNIVSNTQKAYAISAGNLESSTFSFSTVNEVFIENSSFLNNQGTPLTVKNKPETYLSLKGEIHFTNNTGVLGGAQVVHFAIYL